MGRLSKNNCDYFPHDANMRNHRKVKAIRAKFPVSGYSIWSMILEYLTGIDGNEFEYSDMEFELMSGDFGFSATEIRDVVNYCITLEMLFNRNGFIYSESLDEKLLPVYQKRKVAKEISKKQSRKNGKFNTDKPDGSELLLQESTEMPQSKVNKSRVKKSKIIKEFVPPTLDEVKSYFKLNGFLESVAIRFYNGYSESIPTWHDTNGKPVLSWKQKAQNVWFTNENRDQSISKNPAKHV